MPKSKPTTKTPGRANPLAKKIKVKRPQVQVTYEDGQSRPNVLSMPRKDKTTNKDKDVKGKGKAPNQDKLDIQAEVEAEAESSSSDEEDVKPIIVKEEDGAFQTAFEQSLANPYPTATPGGGGSSGASFIIIAGSYEKNLYGIEGTFITSVDGDEDDESPEAPELKLVPSFIFPAHMACIKSLSVSQGAKWLVTGSDDEYIKVWDLRKRKEVGMLNQHVGAITSLTFPTPSHLLSTSEDSTITVFRTRDWVPLRTLKGHTGKVNCVDVHPSGKIALSVGRDQTLRMWDLMRGRGASSLGLGWEAEVVRFSRGGRVFAILGLGGIEIYTIGMKKVATLTHPKRKRLHDIRFGTVISPEDEEVELLFTGTEDGKVYAWEIQEEEAEDEDGEVCVLKGVFGGHTNRVKNVDFLITDRPAPYPALPIIVTVSSDGKMNVHDVTSIFRTDTVEDEIAPIASYDTLGSRLVCCRVAQVTRPSKQVKQEQVMQEVVKKEEPESGNGLRFKDDQESGDDAGEADGMDEDDQQEEEQEEEDEQEEELEDEVEEE